MWFVGNEKRGSVGCRDARVDVKTGGGQEDGQSSNHRRRERARRRRLGSGAELPPHALYTYPHLCPGRIRSLSDITDKITIIPGEFKEYESVPTSLAGITTVSRSDRLLSLEPANAPSLRIHIGVLGDLTVGKEHPQWTLPGHTRRRLQDTEGTSSQRGCESMSASTTHRPFPDILLRLPRIDNI